MQRDSNGHINTVIDDIPQHLSHPAARRIIAGEILPFARNSEDALAIARTLGGFAARLPHDLDAQRELALEHTE